MNVAPEAWPVGHTRHHVENVQVLINGWQRWVGLVMITCRASGLADKSVTELVGGEGCRGGGRGRIRYAPVGSVCGVGPRRIWVGLVRGLRGRNGAASGTDQGIHKGHRTDHHIGIAFAHIAAEPVYLHPERDVAANEEEAPVAFVGHGAEAVHGKQHESHNHGQECFHVGTEHGAKIGVPVASLAKFGVEVRIFRRRDGELAQ